AAKHDSENHHCEKWPHERPGNAYNGLFVTDRNVPPCKNCKQLAIVPNITPIVSFGPPRFEDEHIASRRYRIFGHASIESFSRAARTRRLNAIWPNLARTASASSSGHRLGPERILSIASGSSSSETSAPNSPSDNASEAPATSRPSAGVPLAIASRKTIPK